jgi:poly(hydroxyalkanoate) granule-associated protein
MVKKVKGNADSQLSQSVRESAHLIWLAGLGAFAKVGEEGGKLFDTLIKEGEKVEERAREAASGKLEEVREMAGETRGKVADTWDKVEQIFEDRLARVLGQLGVPNHDDLQELIQRVDALQQHIDGLRKAREGRDS